jgi:hypothetical protein
VHLRLLNCERFYASCQHMIFISAHRYAEPLHFERRAAGFFTGCLTSIEQQKARQSQLQH